MRCALFRRSSWHKLKFKGFPIANRHSNRNSSSMNRYSCSNWWCSVASWNESTGVFPIPSSAILVVSVPFYRFSHHWQSLLIVYHLPHHFFSRLASGETAHEKEAFLKGKTMLKDGESWCRTTLAFKGFAVSFMGKYLQNLILISVFTHTYRIIESYRYIYIYT